jgi:hypothetical protein
MNLKKGIICDYKLQTEGSTVKEMEGYRIKNNEITSA